RDDFHPPIEIARHPVSRTDVDLFLTAVGEVKDATVFEEWSDDAADVNGFRQPRLAGTNHARAPDDQIDFDARLRRLVKSFDDVQVGQPVDLGGNVSGAAHQRMCCFALDQIHHALPEVQWCNHQAAVFFLD